MKFTTRMLLLSWAGLSSSTFAADNAPASDIDQIVVTAARTPLTISRVGSAVTVITREQIERREARHVSDLLRSVPGFSVSHTGATGSQTQVRVRGAEANHILVLIDGVRANDPATGDEFRWEYLSTGNIERIEIVRGPQSSLWGSDAVSAVVHVITRRDHKGSDISGYAEGGTSSAANAGLNGAFGNEKWSLNGAVEHLSTDGSNIARTGNEKDDSDLTTASLSARAVASDSLSFALGIRAVDAYTQFDPVDFFVTGLPTDGDVATDTSNLYARIGARLSNSGSAVVHSLSARFFDSDNQNLVDGVKDSSSGSDRFTLAYQSDIKVGKDLLSLAIEHERTRFEQRGAIVFGDPNQGQEINAASLIAEYQRLSGERLSWIISARFDDNSDFDDSLNGRFSANYRLSDATTLRASVGTGQKNPTFTERFGFFPGQFIGNPDLKPERSISYDLGFDQRLGDGDVRLHVSLFQQDLSDEINGFVFDPLTFLSTAENVNGDSKRDGVEVAARWALNDLLDLGFRYTYTNSTEPGFQGNDVRELRRPRHAGGLSADFRTANERFSASLNADYGGDRSDIFFPPFPQPSEIVTLDSYWLVDLAMRYQVTANATLFVRASNLLDESYEQVYGYRTGGRATYIGLRANFGTN